MTRLCMASSLRHLSGFNLELKCERLDFPNEAAAPLCDLLFSHGSEAKSCAASALCCSWLPDACNKYIQGDSRGRPERFSLFITTSESDLSVLFISTSTECSVEKNAEHEASQKWDDISPNCLPPPLGSLSEMWRGGASMDDMTS